MIITYTVGFAFDPRLKQVILIEKNTPKWQAGHWNGIGGKIRDDESPISSMKREFYEETSFYTEENFWQQIGLLDGYEWVVHVFVARIALHCFYSLPRDYREGTIAAHPVDALPSNILENLAWLVPLAKYSLIRPRVAETKRIFKFEVFYEGVEDGNNPDDS